MKRVVNLIVSFPIYGGISLLLILGIGRLVNIVEELNGSLLTFLPVLGVMICALGLIFSGGLMISNIFGYGPYILLKFFEKQSILLEVDDNSKKVVGYLRKRKFFWRWDKNLSKFSAVENIPVMESVGFRLSPITQNPKVRDLTFHFFLFLSTDDVTSLQSLYGALHDAGDSGDWPKMVRRLLYDFAEENSQVLARLYNPLRKEQQEEFRRLAICWLGPKLTPLGIAIGQASFGLN